MAFDDGVKTVSGSVAHTDDAATKVPFVSVKCGIEPTLTGVSQVVATQTGENLFDKATVTDNTWIVVNDTTTESAVGYRTSDYIPVKANTKYYVSTKSSNRSAYYDRNKNGIAYFSFSGGASFTCLYDGYIRITIKNDIDIDTFIVNEGNTAITYEPYKGTTYTASLSRTIHGGEVDIVNGTGTETYGVIDMGSLNWLIGTLNGAQQFYVLFPDAVKPSTSSVIADILVEDFTVKTAAQVYLGTSENMIISINAQGYLQVRDFDVSTASDFKTSVTGKKLVYKKATPTDFTFTPITPTPETVGNVNNVYCNTGDTELTYYDNAHGFAEVTVNKTGKNLFDISKVATTGTTAGISWSISGNEITISGTATSSGWKTFVEFKLPHKGTYHFHMNATGNVGYFLRGWTQLVGKDVTEVCNDPSQVYRIAIAVTTAGQTYEGTISEIQIELGSQATSYEPYEAVSKTAYLHKVIYGGTADVIRGTCEPKNLLPMTNYDGGVYNPDVGRQLSLTVSQTQFEKTGGVYSVTTSASWKTFTVLFPIISGATYYEKWTLSVESGQQGSTRAYLDEDFKVLAKYNNNSSDPITTNGVMSPPTGAKYLAITWTNRGTAVQTLNITEPQIEKGTSASDFSPHFEPFSFPPISMGTDEGENTLYADEGDSAIVYRKAVE